MLASYEADFAAEWGRAVRNNFLEFNNILTTTVANDSSAADKWNTTAGGGMKTAGIGGPLTGKGGDLMILDDYCKNAEEAASPTIRDKWWDWWATTFYTRFEPGANVITLACLAGETRIPLSDGRWVFIKDVRGGDEVFAFDGQRFVKRKVLDQRLSGVDDTLQIKTARHSITANSKHPFLVVPNPNGHARPKWNTEWRLAQDLRIGDLVVTAAELPTNTVKPPVAGWDTPERLWFLGFMFGDGWVTSWAKKGYDKVRNKCYPSRSWAVYAAFKKSEELNTRIADMFEACFGRRPVAKLKERYWRLDSNRSGREMEALGLIAGAGAKGKKFPEWVYGLPSILQQSFLRGLMAADGCKQKRGKGYRLGMANFDLVDGARKLSFMCGVRPSNIFSRDYFIQAPNSPAPVKGTMHSASFSFPEEGENRNPSLVYGDIPSDIRIEKITSITSGIKQDVYDLAVDGEANFVAEGFCTHNTRWHEDDLIGRLLAQEEENKKQGLPCDNWEVYNFPAIAYGLGEKNGEPVRDSLKRKDGDALWPERYPVEALAKIRTAVRIGPWNALYQQSPVPPDGDFFKRQDIEACKYEIEDVKADDPDSGTVVLIADGRKMYYPINEMTTFLVADTAMTEKKENDATCIGIWWITPRRHLVLKAMWHGRLRGPQVEQKIHQMYKDHGCLFMAIENKANGITAIQKFMDMAVAVKKLPAVADKVTRATPLQTMFEQHRVWLPVDCPYWQEIWKEFLKFPKGAHDDIVDMMAHAGIVLSQQTYDTDGPPAVIDMVEAEHSDEASLL